MWRSPTAASEDRNGFAVPNRAIEILVALVYRDERGSQPGRRLRRRRPDHAGGARPPRRARIATDLPCNPACKIRGWRSPTVASEDRNVVCPTQVGGTPHVVALAHRGERGPQLQDDAAEQGADHGWRSPTATSQDRNVTTVVEYLTGEAGWRSPTATSEDRNPVRLLAPEDPRGKWRSPTKTSEDRNQEGLGTDPSVPNGGARPPRRARIATSVLRCIPPPPRCSARPLQRARIAIRKGLLPGWLLNDSTNSNRILLPVSGYGCQHDRLGSLGRLDDEAGADVHSYVTGVGGAVRAGGE
jgi:hypothetical protein